LPQNDFAIAPRLAVTGDSACPFFVSLAAKFAAF
jgi:hypothetical protein